MKLVALGRINACDVDETSDRVEDRLPRPDILQEDLLGVRLLPEGEHDRIRMVTPDFADGVEAGGP